MTDMSPLKTPKPGTPEYGLALLWKTLKERKDEGLTIASKQALAAEIGIKKQAFAYWRNRVPIDHVLQIESLLGIDRTVLRPDIHPPQPQHVTRFKPTGKKSGKR